MNVAATQEYEHGRTHSPEIRAPVDLIPPRTRLFGCHVCGRAHDGSCASRREFGLLRFEHFGDPEVEDLEGSAARDKQVVRLDIAVNHVATVSGSEHPEERVHVHEQVDHGEVLAGAFPLCSRVSPSRSSITMNADPSFAMSSSRTLTAPSS